MNLTPIKNLIEHLLAKNKITKDRLLDDGAIFYQNGQDGTEGDYTDNQTCEFMCFYKTNNKGAIKLNQRGKKFDVFIYKEEDPKEILKHYSKRSSLDLYKLCDALNEEFDKKQRINEKITEWVIPDGLGKLENN